VDASIYFADEESVCWDYHAGTRQRTSVLASGTDRDNSSFLQDRRATAVVMQTSPS
jgi:hypothetical protein